MLDSLSCPYPFLLIDILCYLLCIVELMKHFPMFKVQTLYSCGCIVCDRSSNSFLYENEFKLNFLNIKLQTFSFIINTKVNKTKAWNKMKNKRYQTVGTNRKIVETVYRGRHPFTENLRYMTAHFYGLVYVQFLCSSIPESFTKWRHP